MTQMNRRRGARVVLRVGYEVLCLKTCLFGALLIGCMFVSSCSRNPADTGQRSQAVAAGEAETGSQNTASAAVQHFWFDYQGQPDPGRRVWVRVDASTWTELYPSGNQSRYRLGDRATIQGLKGTTVRKVAGDPQQSRTLNDGSFEVFIPDRDSPRLILAFRNRQHGQWTAWQPLALIHPID